MNVIIISFAAIGALFLLLAVLRLRRRRFIAAGSHTVSGLALLAFAGLFSAIAMNIHTYERLTYERPIAELRFTQIAPNQFQAHLRYPSGKTRLFDMLGDEWQLDARILKWQGFANVLGMDSQYRLERISGRYRNLHEERNGTRSVHALADDAGLDLWQISQRHQRWLPWLDARYGSATYLPMTDGAVFEVHLTQSGLLARPSNPDARDAVRDWP